jgi:hypothetical protein
VHLWSKVVKFLMTCPESDRLVSGLRHNYLGVFRGFTFLLGSPIKYRDRIASYVTAELELKLSERYC